MEPKVDFPGISGDAGDEQEQGAIVNVGTDVDALFESDDSDDEATNAAQKDEDPIAEMSQDDLDAMFGDQEEPAGISSIVEAEQSYDDPDDAGDVDDIPDPEPLPASLTTDIPDNLDDDDEIPVRRRMPPRKKKSRTGLYVMLVVVIVLSGLGGAMLFLRDTVIRMVPAIAPVYEMIGLAAPLGDGLKIDNVSSERTSEDNVDFLVVSGDISNISDSDKMVPLIKAMMVDSNGVEIQSVVQEPSAAMIPSGETLSFSVTIEEPSPLARRLEVTFAPRPAE